MPGIVRILEQPAFDLGSQGPSCVIDRKALCQFGGTIASSESWATSTATASMRLRPRSFAFAQHGFPVDIAASKDFRNVTD